VGAKTAHPFRSLSDWREMVCLSKSAQVVVGDIQDDVEAGNIGDDVVRPTDPSQQNSGRKRAPLIHPRLTQAHAKRVVYRSPFLG